MPNPQSLPTYAHWSEVPRTLASKTQLGSADLPRAADGPVRGYVAGFDYRGKRAEFRLYGVSDSPPTAATGPQLAAAAARRTTPARVCADCGARPQLPLSERHGRPLCSMCHRLARTVDEQIELRRRRTANADWARELLHGAAPLAVVWTEIVDAPAFGERPFRAAVAARVQVADQNGRQFADLLIRLTGPRTVGAPEDALPTAEGTAALARALQGRRNVVFGPLQQVLDRLAALHHPLTAAPSTTAGHTIAGPNRPAWSDAPAERYRQWRSELDPATGELLTPWPPGSATRAWWCLRQMADTPDHGRPGRSTGEERDHAGQQQSGPAQVLGEQRVRITVTGSAAAGQRVASLLAADGGLQRVRATAPVPSREHPGRLATTMTAADPDETDAASGPAALPQAGRGTPTDLQDAGGSALTEFAD